MPLFIHFPAEEDWKRWAHQISIPLQSPALIAERTIPLSTQGEELVRSFNKAKVRSCELRERDAHCCTAK